MRTVFWAVLLLALLGIVASSRRESPAERSAGLPAQAAALELLVAWEGAPRRVPASNLWQEAYRVSNLSAIASGPLHLRLQTPLGLAAESLLTANLDPGGVLHGTIEIAPQPGLSELCIDVRAVEGGRTLDETDASNNRACRRIDRRERVPDEAHTSRRPEEAS